MYAIVVTSTSPPGSSNLQVKRCRTLSPKSATGFVKGFWSTARDRTTGLSFVAFKTKEDAENAAKMARSNPTPPGVTIDKVEVREVVAEA